MKIDIVQENKNPVLKREEIIFSVKHEGEATPSKISLHALLVKEKNKNPEHVEITRIFTKPGKQESMAWARIWKDKKVEVLTEKRPEEKPEKSETRKPEEKPEKKEIKAEEPEKVEEKIEEKQLQKEELPAEKSDKKKEEGKTNK